MSRRTWLIILLGLTCYVAVMMYPVFRDHTGDYVHCLSQQYVFDHGRFPKTIDDRMVRQLEDTYHDRCLIERGDVSFTHYFLTAYTVAFILGIAAIIHGFIRRRARHDSVMNAIEHIVATEINMGDVFKNNSNSIINNRSELRDTLIKYEGSNPVLAQSLAAMASYIARSDNPLAARAFKDISSEMAKPAPEKSTISFCWDVIKAALPSIKDMVDITTGMEAFLK